MHDASNMNRERARELAMDCTIKHITVIMVRLSDMFDTREQEYLDVHWD